MAGFCTLYYYAVAGATNVGLAGATGVLGKTVERRASEFHQPNADSRETPINRNVEIKRQLRSDLFWKCFAQSTYSVAIVIPIIYATWFVGISDACRLELVAISMPENVNKHQHFAAFLHFLASKCLLTQVRLP